MSNASISTGRIGRLIFYELDHGDSRDQVVEQLVQLGFELDEARYMVDSACCCRRVGLLVDGARHRRWGGRLALICALLAFGLASSGADYGWFVTAVGASLWGAAVWLHGVRQHSEAARIEARHPRRPSSQRELPWPAFARPRRRAAYLRRRGVGLPYHVRPRGEASHLTLRI